MKRGDVVLVDLPRPRGGMGREQYGLRPAIVVQDEPNLKNLSTVLIVPLTSNILAERFAGSIRISSSAENGLDVDSIALTQQLRAVDRRRIQNILGEVSSTDLAELDHKMRRLLSL